MNCVVALTKLRPVDYERKSMQIFFGCLSLIFLSVFTVLLSLSILLLLSLAVNIDLPAT